MEKSFGCFFYLKKKGKSLSEELPVYLRVTVDSDSIHISTKRKCLRANWNVTHFAALSHDKLKKRRYLLKN